MKTKSIALLVSVLTLLSGFRTTSAQGTAFTYQGRLDDGGSAANGTYDLTFSVWNSASGPPQIGGTVTNLATGVSNGLFTAALDFGAGVFTGPDRWLEIGVRTNGGGAFATLSPRQKLTATPYAITAGNVSGVLSNSAIAGTYSSAVNFSNSLNQFTGSFTGNGAGLSNVNAQTFGGLLPSSFWTLNGNSVAPGQFLGSTNDQPVEIRVNGQRAFRLEPNANAPNVIGGLADNQVDAGVVGATISGGGANFSGVSYSNRVSANFATISGGVAHNIEPNAGSASIAGGQANLVRSNSFYSSIAGGVLNTIDLFSYGSFIGGGWSNTNGSPYSVIGGGVQNTIGPDAGLNGSAVIGGGSANSIQSDALSATIAGGLRNAIQTGSPYASIGGGAYNAIENSVYSSTVAGGYGNAIRADSFNSAIGGGYTNVIATNSPASIIGGGTFNLIGPSAPGSIIGGGTGQSITGTYGTIAGGEANSIQGGASHASIVGGTANVNSGGGAFIGGGYGNRAENFDAVVVAGLGNINSGYRAFIGSGENNVISNTASYSVIGGGRINSSDSEHTTIAGGGNNRIYGASGYSTIGGGVGNSISNEAPWATISGGIGNQIRNRADRGFIGGGERNAIGPFAYHPVIGGGMSNSIQFNIGSAAITGGKRNTIASGGDYSFIGGGQDNLNAGIASVIGGGESNTNRSLSDHSVIVGGANNLIVGSQLLPVYDTIGGGQGNLMQTNAIYSVIGGGIGNTILTNAQYATIPGGASNSAAGRYSFAAGRRAKALHDGSFVWADSTDADFASTATNQFSIRAMGGLRLETSGGSATLNGQPILSGTVPGSSLSGTYPNALTFNNAGNSFTGNGAGLTSLNAANITSGTLNDARLSANVALLDHNQLFTGANAFNNPANSFTGDGTGLTNVNAAALGGLGSSNYWQLGGNSGNPNTILGTLDSSPLSLFAGNQPGLRLNGVTRPTGFITGFTSPMVIGGSYVNGIFPGVLGGTIGGGGMVERTGLFSETRYPNTISDDFGTIGGGLNNTVGNTNVDLTDVRAGTIAGGETNRVLANYGTIGGGFANVAGSSNATVAGGSINLASGPYSTVAGGGNNTSSGRSSVVAGGGGRDLFGGGPYPNTASGDWSVVGGGWNNVASGYSSIIAGGANNTASGAYSFAAGLQAKANHSGSFVWADSHFADFTSTANDQFSIRAAGGVRLNDDTSMFFGSQVRQMLNLWNTNYAIGVQASSLYFRCNNGSVNDGFIWYKGGAHNDNYANPGGGVEMMHLNDSGLYVRGTFVSSSDRNVKAGFEAVDSKAILEKVAALPITRWHYTNDTQTPHIGPVAQDFQAAFDVGPDDKHITTVDADGIALAAIKGLNQKVEERLKDKEKEVQELRGRIAELEKIVAKLANDPK
jgi:hypothetical protein